MLNSACISELQAIVGPANVIISHEQLEPYSHDAGPWQTYPSAAVLPACTHEVSLLLAFADRERIPIVPRGAGTGMTGGAVPVQKGIVLSLERMNRIIEIDDENLVAVVEPGLITGELQKEVERRGLFYPPDPASHEKCTIGGNVAECAGGLRAVKYGVTKDYVLALEVVLPGGDVIHTGARTMKSVAGYDLTKLFVGSEGTLGVVTQITLKLLRLPEAIRTITAYFPDIETTAKAVSMIMASPVVPRALEFADAASLKAVENHLGQDLFHGAAAMLLVETDGSPEQAERDANRISDMLHAAGAQSVHRATSEQEREQLWSARRSISPALKTLNLVKVNEDIVVPRSKIPDVLGEIETISKKYGFLIVNFGHAGDGNLHTNIMVRQNELDKGHDAAREIFAAVLKLRGSISGEHGIGIGKAAYLPMELNQETLNAMRRVKQAFDPNNILNPGKIFLSKG